jgi:hypothetical protein
MEKVKGASKGSATKRWENDMGLHLHRESFGVRLAILRFIVELAGAQASGREGDVGAKRNSGRDSL